MKIVKRHSLMRVLGLLLGPVLIATSIVAFLDGDQGDSLSDPVAFALAMVYGLIFIAYGVIGIDIDMEFGAMVQEGRERRARWRQRLGQYLNR